MNHCLEYQNEQYKQLYNTMVNSTQNILKLQQIFEQLEKAINLFTKSIQTIGEEFHQLISGDCNEGDTIVCSYQQLSNYLLRMAQSFNSINVELKQEIIDPFDQFIKNYRQTNRNLSAQAKQYIKELEQSREQMNKAQQEYWKMMENSERAAQTVQRIVDSIDQGTTKEDFQRMFTKSCGMQEQAKEAENDYKTLIEVTNKKWENFEIEWARIFRETDMNDESRIRFSKQTLFSILKTLGSFQLNNPELIEYYQEKFQEINQNIKKENKPDLKTYIERIMEKKGIKQVQIKKEEYISYEQWLKINENQEMLKLSLNDSGKSMLTGQWVLVGDSITDDERKIMDNYIESVVNGSPIQSSQSQLLNQKQEEEEPKQVKPAVQLAQAQQIIYLKQILQKSTARTYFVDKFIRSYSNKNSYSIQLQDETFNELVSIIRHWLNHVDLNDTFDCDEIHKLLQITIKISKKGSNDRLSANLADLDIWQRLERWGQLYQYVCSKKIEEKRQKAQLLQNQTISVGGVVKKSIGFIGKGFKLIKNLGGTDKQYDQFSVNEQEVVYLILEEINLFLINLQLKPQISSEIILNLALGQITTKLDKEHIVRLLEKQENRNNSLLKRQFISDKKLIKSSKEDKFIKKQLSKKENKIIYAIKFTLNYLTIADNPGSLLLVSKEFNSQLSRKIDKFYLMNYKVLYNQQNESLRRRFIKTLLKIDQDKLDYRLMKIQVGIDMNIHMSSIEEIISLDVHRSLHIHQKSINSSILQSLLRTYAYFNPEVSYCQGMNYIAGLVITSLSLGYLYLTFNDEQVTYKVFDKIMRSHFKDLFIKDFQKLKLMFYQFDRLFSMFLTELAEHFKQEKIDPSYFAASWFITIFSSVFQYVMRSALLNIIWDIFLVDSWKGFFKCTFYLLYILSQKLLKMEFDQILHFLSEVIRNELFQIDNEVNLIEYINGQLNSNFNLETSLKKQILKQFKITNRLLYHLENEYNCFQLNFNQKLKEYQKKQKK